MSIRKIAVYGLSTETQKELPHLSAEYEIVGLLDGFKTDGAIYGYPIIPLENAMQQGAERIIVVARPGSCKAIAKRIGDACRENNVELLDIRGKNLLESNKVVYDFKNVKGYTRAEVIDSIRKADVVSFDLFDTLIMRNIAYPTDVIELVDEKLKEKGYAIDDFSNKRIAVEKNISQGYAPKLSEIYADIVSDGCEISGEELANIEFQVDFDLLVPRLDSIKLISEAKKLGKKVYITTDSYYRRNQMKEILSLCKIEGYDDVLISCEYGIGKADGLLEELIRVAGTKNILHIGDDDISDIKAADNSGIASFQLYSGMMLLDFLGGLEIEDLVSSLSDKIKLGMFVAKIFNSPFQFEDEERKLSVADVSGIGYLFCAPMITDFVKWYGEVVAEKVCRNIWFCARDGYLIQKLYHKFYPEQHTDYFLTSRIAAIRAGVENIKDIQYVDSMKFSGSVADNLKCRFGIDAWEVNADDITQSKEGLVKYSEGILKRAVIQKKNTRNYIQKLGVEKGNIAFFDFVAKGTNQMYAQRLIDNHIIGVYFLQLEPDFMKDKNLEIYPFFTEEERSNSAIFDNYYILETLLTSPEPSLDEFDSQGNPVYASETRSEKDIACFMRAQEGILEYVDTYLKICPKSERKINKKLDEKFLMLIHNVAIRDKDFLNLRIEDPFFNRVTDIADVL
ncbi:MAG: hypothetical protein GX299_08030 [Epulopiscium sp.]|nr:hypothetical protein [Candidatus Epulonipiscium sp.]